ncbi:tryptophan synthase subunit alpha [Luteibacter rhizovicinus DSM 16549]|uniref:Tryptophan synthase alpha chain n=1 Tax=Luteibacter rhizovicinus DSM 16549 TaxID=1440763 RepID=A0A1L3EVR5_9GAMM|nr:tryptophan synthase subunit alpha [Luteibacter rhizovicinus]APG05156.1 tryptophan synthase subunit alpha [Luteibacter rhizovicinus DSM 16549]KLD72842.1 tryptophan synthase alpha chain [Xanthomonas hyacinthi DSM 19077]
MSRIERRFAALKAAGRTGLIPFVTAGDPSPDDMVPMLHALVAAGADVIELGVPFSDPMADGPVIQHASERAIAKGVGLHNVLAWVAAFRETDDETPIVLMGYLNPIEMYGYEEFAEDAVEKGVDGVLMVDCPLEESHVLAPLRAAGLDQILLASPTTTAARLTALSEAAAGFLYYVSFAGITGAAQLSTGDIAERVAGIRAKSKAPVAVGFGVRDAASAVAIGAFADAVVIGSALVDRLSGATSADDLAGRAHEFLAPIRAALDAR